MKPGRKEGPQGKDSTDTPSFSLEEVVLEKKYTAISCMRFLFRGAGGSAVFASIRSPNSPVKR